MPILPSSISPHILVLATPDLDKLLASHALPPLHHILQSFSPLQGVTTRTIALSSVTHSSFALRFSNLPDIEAACREDEETRAGRMVDWISARIGKRAAAWVQEAESNDEKDRETKWWEELRRCIDDDRTPSRAEGWNHPVALILATSTFAPNPLQAITELHSRAIDLPPWIDSSNILRYTLIVQTPDSPLSDEESIALFNATKKQFGLSTHLLSLTMSTPTTAKPIALFPNQLPSLDVGDSPEQPLISLDAPTEEVEVRPVQELAMTEEDLAAIGRFVKELTNSGLLPWMESCVSEWNNNYSSSRRLPSRLFTSTRRLFGSSSSLSSLSAPTPSSPTSPSPLSPSSSTASLPTGTPLPQQRRLAEFATLLGDLKLAVSVWESLRKSTTHAGMGADVLPLLVAPTKALASLASMALAPLMGANMSAGGGGGDGVPASVQVRAVRFAVRWERGVSELKELDGERWLVWAAGSSEEPPSALLLAEAARMSAQKGANRRAAMWYASAASRLEKYGIKPLTMHFLKKAHELYSFEREKSLSPLFYDILGPNAAGTSDGVPAHIEHSLGRLKYTIGDTEGAVRLFLGLLKGSSGKEIGGDDKVYLEDFRQAFQHLKTTEGEHAIPGDLKLPVALCQASETRIRLSTAGATGGAAEQLERLYEVWRSFWRAKGGKGRLDGGGKAAVGEKFWIELALENPLDAEITLGDLTVQVEMDGVDASDDENGAAAPVQVEVVSEITLGPLESLILPISVVCSQQTALRIPRATYSFLSLLPVSESLATRGKRLNDTVAQRQSVMYPPDVVMKTEVGVGGGRLRAELVGGADDISLAHGELRRVVVKVSNVERVPVREIWYVPDEGGMFWLDSENNRKIYPHQHAQSARSEIFASSNSIAAPEPHPLPLDQLHSSSALHPGEFLMLPFLAYGESIGSHDVILLFVFRESEDTETFYTSRTHSHVEVVPLLDTNVTVKPGASSGQGYILGLEVENIAPLSEICITQLTCVSPAWESAPLGGKSIRRMESIHPRQSGSIYVRLQQSDDTDTAVESMRYFNRKIEDLIQGRKIEKDLPSEVNLTCTHVAQSDQYLSTSTPSLQHIIQTCRRHHVSRSVIAQFPGVPPTDHPYIFPLYTPTDVSLLISWEIPSERRAGFTSISGVVVGPGDGSLREVFQRVEDADAKSKTRSLYAETGIQKNILLRAIRESEWNVDENPLAVQVRVDGRIQHDFTAGPCKISVSFIIRNLSLTTSARFMLSLPNGTRPPGSLNYIPSTFIGALTHRGDIGPSRETNVRVRMWATQPGTYSLHGWSLETDIGSLEDGIWISKARFVQDAEEGGSPVTEIRSVGL
ncbi:hypothetical protein BOTBODRAFT_148671 [Botryobasidium botryosum FD-172 SS1]|uniref:TPPC8 third Ig-like domain-containing protein n=1 Tax=Botryobasidium botryosum (strain FD-172 SS1) TaxID=930990 RepID=A0A067MA20_BOTB1|nr:hypothetical protein BOTBODRAFT_148671 [Botryobasidium botryosum FD-172 SS1]